MADIVDIVANLAAQLEDVAKTLGRDQRGLRPLALDDGIDDERGTVDDALEAGDETRLSAREFGDARRHGSRRVIGSGEQLEARELSGLVVEQEKIGEGSTDVTAEPQHVRPASRAAGASSDIAARAS